MKTTTDIVYLNILAKAKINNIILKDTIKYLCEHCKISKDEVNKIHRRYLLDLNEEYGELINKYQVAYANTNDENIRRTLSKILNNEQIYRAVGFEGNIYKKVLDTMKIKFNLKDNTIECAMCECLNKRVRDVKKEAQEYKEEKGLAL